MLTYPQIISSTAASQTPVITGDYPQIDSSNPLGANLLWMVDLTLFTKDSAQQEVTFSASSDMVTIPTSVDFNSIFANSELTLVVHGAPTAWESSGNLLEMTEAGSTVLDLRRDGSGTEAGYTFPGGNYWGGNSEGYVQVSATPDDILQFGLTQSGDAIELYRETGLYHSFTKTAFTDSFGGVDEITLWDGISGNLQQAYIFNRRLLASELASLFTNPQQVIVTQSEPEPSHPIIDTNNAIGASIIWLAYPEAFDKDSNDNQPVLNNVTIDGSGAVDQSLDTYAEWPWPAGDLSPFGTGEFTIWYGGITSEHRSDYAQIIALVDSSGNDILRMHLRGGYGLGCRWPNGDEQTWSRADPGTFTSLTITFDGETVKQIVDGGVIDDADTGLSTDVGSASIAAVRLGHGIAGTHKTAFLANRALSLAEIASLHSDPYQVLTNPPS